MGWTVKNKTANKMMALTAILLAIELFDELVGGVLEPAWPLIRDDLNLSYGQVGLLLAVPNIASQLVEPLFGILADMGHRHRLMLAGAWGFGIALLILACSHTFMGVLIGFMVLTPAAGALVNVAQATLMDLHPSRHERTMARWNLAGSLGNVLGPLVLAGAIAFDQGWQQALLLLAGLSGLVLVWLWRIPNVLANDSPNPASSASGLVQGLGSAISALKQPNIVRWLILLQVSNLMLDGFQGYVALYFVDVMGTSATEASVVMTFWLGVGFLGDLLLIPLLENVRSFTYLKVSSMLVLFLYPAFLLVPWLSAKYILLGGLGLLSAGWYSILKGQLYTAMPGQSGAVITLSNLFGLVGSLMPLLLGFLAFKIGLESTLWVLVITPVALLIGLLV